MAALNALGRTRASREARARTLNAPKLSNFSLFLFKNKVSSQQTTYPTKGSLSTMSVFVTVGSTSFDDLIRAVTSDEVLEFLGSRGIRKVVLQIGRGELIPERASPVGEVVLEWFRFKDDIGEDIRESTLVVGHGGAGTILECLGKRRPILVVLNENLMENHQGELAERLAEEGLLRSTTCSGLLGALKKFFSDPPKTESYVAEPYMFRGFLENVMGFS